MIKNGIMVFFYVDDIIFAYRKENEEDAAAAITELQKNYALTGGKDLQWFLGVEVIRDRPNRMLWLSQASYIDKIAQLATRKDLRHDTPMNGIEILPRTGYASPSEINLYQRKIGSLLYTAITTRPDIAFSTLRLARFLINPGLEH